GLGLEEAPRYIGQFLRELLDRAVQQGRSLGVVTDQHVVEGLLADLLRGHVAERILARFAQGLAPAVEDLAESTLGGTVAHEALLVLQFDIEAVDIDRGQPAGPVVSDTRGNGGKDVLSHMTLPVSRDWRDNGRGIRWFQQEAQ